MEFESVKCSDCGAELKGDAVWKQCECGGWERVAVFTPQSPIKWIQTTAHLVESGDAE